MSLFGAKKTAKVDTDPQKIEELLTRGIENIFPNRDFLKVKMLRGEQVTLYLGIDPTGKTLHLGHVIPLKKLGQFQKLGHKIILLIGDFTAMIGDPTDKTATRTQLTHKEVLENCKEYKKQASKFISFSGNNPADFKFNSAWLSKMNFADVLDLGAHMTVQQMLERDMFEKRMQEGKPIYIHEFMYPLMQGYDSVAMNVDGEIGGNDQTFNMLAGRNLLKDLKGKEKFVIATKLLTDSTGKKMGKTENNMVSLDQTADDMFGSVMSWGDELIVPGFEIVTDIPLAEIESIKASMSSGANPKDFKVRLAKEIVTMCHDKKSADSAEQNFENTFAKGGVPKDIIKIVLSGSVKISDSLVEMKIVESKTDLRRLVDAGAVSSVVSGKKISSLDDLENPDVLKIGKHRFVEIVGK
jgi:tyrosyl-tRNA synthetase